MPQKNFIAVMEKLRKPAPLSSTQLSTIHSIYQLFHISLSNQYFSLIQSFIK